MKDKLADMEDRSRRNNIKLRGIPETVSKPELLPYVTDLYKLLLPEEQVAHLLVETIHRIVKPKQLPA